MEIKVIVYAFATLGAISLWIRRMVLHHPSTENTLEAKTGKNASANQEELDDSQAAEVVATWNLLNPP